MNVKQLTDDLPTGLAGPVAVVAHDAGAANHIAAWLGGNRRENYFGALDGPAKAIFAERCPWLENGRFEKLIPASRVLISGTGWASTLEHDARRLAKDAGCRSIAVIDHWTDYRERFTRSGQEILPDEIWVSDDYAEQLAQREFPSIKVSRLQNAYLERLAGEVREMQVSSSGARPDKVLYLLEPIRDEWGALPQAGEFMALEFFIDHLAALGLDESASIRLRPHPSDPSGKYDRWISARPGLNLTLDDTRSLAASLAWADVVVGCQTYAMVVALAAGKQVVCSIPPGMPRCVLPQKNITHLARLVG